MHELKLLTILVIVALVSVSLGGIASRSGIRSNQQNIISVTFPSLIDDVKLLVNGCNIQIESIAPPGADPHNYAISPDKAGILANSLLIVSTGHAPFELAIRKTVPKDKLIEIPSIPGIELYKLPGAVEENPHMPIYDPRNYRIFITYMSEKLIEKLPKCSTTIVSNEKRILMITDRLIEEYSLKFNGIRGVITHPPLQYAVNWLGVNITVVISAGEEAHTSPKTLKKAERLLSMGSIAVIMVDDNGNPYTPVDEWLLDQAVKYNATIIRVKAPFLQGSILDKIRYVTSQLDMQG